jgi:hypothetical protein
MTSVPKTSHIRVFGKSMFTLSAGWIVSVAWLWYAEIDQHIVRHGAPPPEYGAATLQGGIAPAVLLAIGGWIVRRLAGPAPHSATEWREWWYSFLWSAVPNALLFITVWVMIQEGR